MKTTSKKLILVIELVIYISISGCTSGWWESRHKENLYEELDLYNVKTIAVFPLKNSKLDSNETIEVNKYLMAGLEKIMGNYILTSQEESMEKQNRNSSNKSYIYYLSSVSSVSKKTIKDYAKSINCDALLIL